MTIPTCNNQNVSISIRYLAKATLHKSIEWILFTSQDVDVRLLEEELDELHVAVLGGAHQRRGAVLVADVDVGASLHLEQTFVYLLQSAVCLLLLTSSRAIERRPCDTASISAVWPCCVARTFTSPSENILWRVDILNCDTGFVKFQCSGRLRAILEK